ncbi:hypothetical protein DESPIG_02837 [Desulfovibrio piger ATCC 29098]|uniref:Uncharacterized protein n=1 Tax=Desulfovibrio piger ATCC 29098 TaxID=411464 RepID=B6WXL0_9BACT|nr:hypothetical protein DESPIG_02837 [Desulfovibrio piger ATCC 29098]
MKKRKYPAAARDRSSLPATSPSTTAGAGRPRPSSSAAADSSFPALLDMPVISAV